MSKLLSKTSLGGVQIKNKIVMPPMCMYKSDNSGEIKPFHHYHYVARALGGVGLIIVEATAVEPRGRITNKDLGIWNDKLIEKHKELNDACHIFGAKTALQIAHAGRKSVCNDSTPIAPSSIAFLTTDGYKVPNEIKNEDIENIKNLFVKASIRGEKAGYDFIELHCAHGYLLCEFLSPLTNTRDDSYGGNLDNRIKIVLEIVKEIKENINIPLIVRLSASEWIENGWSLEDSIYLSKELEVLGVNAIHVSGGGNHPNPTLAPKFVPMYQCNYAKEIKKNIGIPVIAVGLINTPENGEALLLGEVCDFVAYGRALLRSPNLAIIAANTLGDNDAIDTSYKRSF